MQNKPPSATSLAVLEAIVGKASAFFAIISGFAALAMIFLVFADATSRTLFLAPVRGTLEIVTYLLLPITVFGAYAYAHHKNQNITMTLLLEKLTGNPMRVNRLVIELLFVIGIGLLFYFGMVEMANSVAIVEASVGLVTIPIWPAKIFMGMGLGMLILQSITIIVHWIAELVEDKRKQNEEIA
jgi:TRAP-type mannitol/chloroaromatic compound transport system permease small subunit